jgi:hypothetical protein
MMHFFRFVRTWKSRISRTLMFFVLVCVACQPVEVPSTPVPTQTSTVIPTIIPTSTETAVIPSPTLTELPSPTAQPTTTGAALPLSKQGPWLAYKHYSAMENEHFILNHDGTGRARVLPECNTNGIQESPSNRLVIFPGLVYLFQPSQAAWTLVYSNWPSCYSDFTGNKEKGLLASLYHETEDAIPELRIYELPSGKIRDQFPLLFRCPDENESCDTGGIEWWNFEMKWSPNGRYLAFSAAPEGPSSDLYMYDTQTGNILRLTSGPDSVAQIWWSPDGRWILMGELHESIYPYTTSLWAVSARDNEMRQLYSLENGFPQSILGWLDDKRFIVFDGTGLNNPLDLPANNLRLVDMESNEIMTLFSGSFMAAELDPLHETLSFWAYDLDPREGYEGPGTYLVSTSNPKIRYMGSEQLYPNWDADLGLFVTEEPCENDPEGTMAFDYKGEWQCVHPSLTANYLSPDGGWQVSVQDGTWLNTNGKQPVQITEGNAVQVIWRPDSQGFFFVENQILYYVSLPQATMVVIDEDIRGNSISYQWLE